MRVSILLTILLSVCLAKICVCQQILTTKIDKIKLVDALEYIERISDYRFFYNNNQIPINTTVTISKGDVLKVIEDLLKPLNVTFRVLENNIIIIEHNNEIIKLKGKTVNVDNELISNVSISTNNGKNITHSDKNGYFDLSVPAMSTIHFTHVGYGTRILNTNEITERVVLQHDPKGIEEIVIIGYGQNRKFTHIGSVSSIQSEEILQTPSASFQNTLSGKLSGFYSQQQSGMPGNDGAEFVVRGISTYTGNQQPLIIIDDIQSSYDEFSNLNPHEIENISILKDASTTAVYGIKGANGVILITSKRGQLGPNKIKYRTESGMQTPTHVPKFLDAYNTAMLRNEALANEGKTPEFSEKSLENFRNNSDPYGHPNINWYNTLFKSYAPFNTQNLESSGGNNKLKHMISVGYLKQNGLMKNFKLSDMDINNEYYFKRYNFRANIDIPSVKSLDFKINIWGNHSERNNPNFHGSSGAAEIAAFSEISRYDLLPPFTYPIYNPDGSWGSANPSLHSPLNSSNNIIGRITHGGYTRNRKNFINFNFIANKQLSFINDNLYIKASLSSSSKNESTRQIVRRDFPAYYYNPKDNSYTIRDPNVSRLSPWEDTYNGGSPFQQVNLQSSISYAQTFSKHSVSNLLLFNQLSTLKSSVEQNENYIPENYRGFTFRTSYDFDNKYISEINLAYNGSSKFSENRRYALFPAISLGWNIAEESFFKSKFKRINLLKLRASYGLVGSDDIGIYKYAYNEIFIRNGPFSFGETHINTLGITEGYLGNNKITWEKETKANLGLDFALYSGILQGKMDAFYHNRYDILTVRNTIPLSFGIQYTNYPPVNIGIVDNKGFEVELGFNKKINNLRLVLKTNISYAKNRIINMDEPPQKHPWQLQTGHSIGTVRQWQFEGFYSHEDIKNDNIAKPIGRYTAGYLKYKDLNKDNIIDVNDKAYIGDAHLHNTNLGINIGLKHKSLGVSAIIQSAINFDIQLGQYLVTPFATNLKPIHLKRWTDENQENAEFPILLTDFRSTYMNSQEASTFWNIDGDYIRLKSLEIHYDLPKKIVESLKIEKCKIFMNGYNLFSLSSAFQKLQFDPEIARNSNFAPYPQQSIFNIGLTMSL